MTGDRFVDCIDRASLLVAVGAGGVGKTTTAATLGLLCALRGRRTLVLTIDPARRLLQALGLDGQGMAANTALPVLPRMSGALLEAARPPWQQTDTPVLDAMMLDPERGAEEMVERLLPDPSLRDEVMGNRIYRALLPALGASPDLVALDLLAVLHRRGAYDVIVLDTPPTHNTVEFLHAGQTFANFINERVLEWFSKVPAPADKPARPSIFARGGSAAMGVLGKLFGAEVLPDIAQFFRSFREVMPRMRAQSEATDALLRSDGTRFVAVTAPGETSLREARHLVEVLRGERLPFAGFIVNRVIQTPASLGDGAAVSAASLDLARRLGEAGMAPEGAAHLAERLREGARRLTALDQADAAHVSVLRQTAGREAFVLVVPQREQEIHTLPELVQLASELVGDAPGAEPPPAGR